MYRFCMFTFQFFIFFCTFSIQKLLSNRVPGISSSLCVSNGDLHLHTRLDDDGGDLLNDLGGAVQIDETLVDAHLVTIPGLGALTTGGLPGGDAQDLGGHAHGSLDLELLLLGAADEVVADLISE